MDFNGNQPELNVNNLDNVITDAINEGTSNPLYNALQTVAGSALTYKGRLELGNTLPTTGSKSGDVWIDSHSDWHIYNGTAFQIFDNPNVISNSISKDNSSITITDVDDIQSSISMKVDAVEKVLINKDNVILSGTNGNSVSLNTQLNVNQSDINITNGIYKTGGLPLIYDTAPRPDTTYSGTKVQTQLNSLITGKEPVITNPNDTTKYYRGDKTFQTLDKASVGLSNVDNTSDLDKPISTLVQTELDLKQPLLDGGGDTGVFLNGALEFSVPRLIIGSIVANDSSVVILDDGVSAGNISVNVDSIPVMNITETETNIANNLVGGSASFSSLTVNGQSLSSNKISEGDTEVKVNDIGTGNIEIKVDGTQKMVIGDNFIQETFPLGSQKDINFTNALGNITSQIVITPTQFNANGIDINVISPAKYELDGAPLINDNITTNTNLWTSTKINTELNTKQTISKIIPTPTAGLIDYKGLLSTDYTHMLTPVIMGNTAFTWAYSLTSGRLGQRMAAVSFDVSNPAVPRLLKVQEISNTMAGYAPINPNYTKLRGKWLIGCNNNVPSWQYNGNVGKKWFVCDVSQAGLLSPNYIFDINNQTASIVPSDIEMYGRYVYIGLNTTSNQLEIWDFGTPTPTYKTTIDLGVSMVIWNMRVYRGYLYIAGSGASNPYVTTSRILDLSDELAPVVYNTGINFPGEAYGLNVSFKENYMYFQSAKNIVKYDISNPRIPVLLKTVPFQNSGVIASDVLIRDIIASERYIFFTTQEASYMISYNVMDYENPSPHIYQKRNMYNAGGDWYKIFLTMKGVLFYDLGQTKYELIPFDILSALSVDAGTVSCENVNTISNGHIGKDLVVSGQCYVNKGLRVDDDTFIHKLRSDNDIIATGLKNKSEAQATGIIVNNNSIQCNVNGAVKSVFVDDGLDVWGILKVNNSVVPIFNQSLNTTDNVTFNNLSFATTGRLDLPVNTDNSTSGTPGAMRWNSVNKNLDIYRDVVNKWQPIHQFSEVSGQSRIKNTVGDMYLDMSGSGVGGVLTQAINNAVVQTITPTTTTVSNNLVVLGDLIVNGTETVLNVQNVIVEDPLIKLAHGNTLSDTLDSGFYCVQNNGFGTTYSGLIRDASANGLWYLTNMSDVEPPSTNYNLYTGSLVVQDLHLSNNGLATGRLTLNAFPDTLQLDVNGGYVAKFARQNNGNAHTEFKDYVIITNPSIAFLSLGGALYNDSNNFTIQKVTGTGAAGISNNNVGMLTFETNNTITSPVYILPKQLYFKVRATGLNALNLVAFNNRILTENTGSHAANGPTDFVKETIASNTLWGIRLNNPALINRIFKVDINMSFSLSGGVNVFFQLSRADSTGTLIAGPIPSGMSPTLQEMEWAYSNNKSFPYSSSAFWAWGNTTEYMVLTVIPDDNRTMNIVSLDFNITSIS